MIIGRKNIQFLQEVRSPPKFLRIDYGTETGMMTTIQTYLSTKVSSDLDDPVHSVIYDVSEVLQENQDFLNVPLTIKLRYFIPHPVELKPTKHMNALMYLKERLYF